MSQKTGESCWAQFFRADAEMLSGPAAFLTFCLAKRFLTSDGWTVKGGDVSYEAMYHLTRHCMAWGCQVCNSNGLVDLGGWV